MKSGKKNVRPAKEEQAAAAAAPTRSSPCRLLRPSYYYTGNDSR